MAATQWVYAFSDKVEDLTGQLGAKGAGLAEMTALGLPVPPGFTITTSACAAFFAGGEHWPPGLEQQLDAAVDDLQKRTGLRLGDPEIPLLVSVRSGATASMPGILDTVLNVGLNEDIVRARAERDARFAWDAYRRFIAMFGDVVLGIHYTRFRRAQDRILGGTPPERATAEELEKAAGALLEVVQEVGATFPKDPVEQLRAAVGAVFRSYNTHRARYYRKSRGISEGAGTAVNVQAMVFGNLGEDSGTGMAETRDPDSGCKGITGAWRPGAQGEELGDTPRPLGSDGSGASLEERVPDVFAELQSAAAALEIHYSDMQRIEFTVENGKLHLLQTTSAQRTAAAAVQVVVDLVGEGLIDRTEALRRIEPASLEMLMRPVIRPGAKRKVVARGLDASPGAAAGRVVFDSSECRERHERDEPTILVRLETTPEDIQGMMVAAGVLTARGGQTSHAAVVARGMGKPCVVGCTDIQVDYSRELFYAGDSVFRRGDWITIDGGTGEVMEGRVEMLAPRTDSGAMTTLLSWADSVARLKVRANADTGADAARARVLGAVGIGLCRTEHMFFRAEALRAIRSMILADDPRARQRALREILPIQRAMFVDLFREMDGLPTTIRLLDPPLGEFLPTREEDVSAVAVDLGVRVEALRVRLMQLHESNPMMGHRGVRVGITRPEVYRTQVRAIFEAACEVVGEGIEVLPEVMVPLVVCAAELKVMRTLISEVAEEVIAEYGRGPSYRIGTMVELPRTALLADRVAQHADFFSFGTNDLTQMTFGFSRDDMGSFFPSYEREGILSVSPLSVFDVDGVGQLVQLGTERGRSARPHLPVGVCGEHGGDPTGVAFFHRIGIDYVSCSPYRVPVARLAAAHAALGYI